MISKIGEELVKNNRQNTGDETNLALKALGLNREQADALKKHYGAKSDNDMLLNTMGRNLAGQALGAIPGAALSLAGALRGRIGDIMLGSIGSFGGSSIGGIMAAKRYSPENADNIINGKDADTDSRNLKDFAHGVEGLTGTALVANALRSGNLTGRATLYHGTSKDAVRGIKEKGLLPTTAENASNTKILESINPERYARSLGKAYLTPEWADAQNYALQTATDRFTNLQNWKNMRTAKINAPLWKMKTVVNPEVDMSYKDWKKRLGSPGEMHTETRKRFLYNNMRNTVAVDGGVGPEYVKGSDKYQRLTLKELGEYIKAKPKTFALGAGKTLAGLGMLGHGAYQLYDRARQAREGQEQK